MAQEYPERTKKLREHFAEIVADIPTTVNDISHEYPEQLKKIKELLSIMLGHYIVQKRGKKYAFTWKKYMKNYQN